MATISQRDTIKTLERSLPDRSHVVANVGLRYLGSNSAAYWTLTGEIYEPHGTWSGAARKRNGRDWDMGGMVHEYVLRAFPKLAPFAALHLSDPNGVPMHAIANGRYFLERGELDTAAKHFRVSVDELPAVEDVEMFVDTQRERWARESREAFELLQSL